MKIKQLRQDLADLQAEEQELRREAQGLLRDDLTDETRARIQEIEDRRDAISDELPQVRADIATWEKYRDEELNAPAARVGRDVVDLDEPRSPEATATPKLFGSFGEQLQAIYRAATEYRTDDRLLQIGAAAQGAGEAIGSDGGFLVQQDFASEIFRKMTQMSSILGLVRRVPVTGNGLVMRTIKESSRATGSRWGGVQGYWVDEGTAPTASNPTFGRIRLSLKKVAALGYSTDELLEDESAMSTIFTDAFAEELSFLTEDSVINGTGAGQPVGILNAAATVSQAKETGQTAATVVSRNLSKMWARLHVRSRGNAVWFINQDVEPQLDELSVPAGAGAVEPRFVTYGPDGVLRIKGRPVLAIEYAATLGTVGDIILADLSQYMMIDKNGVRQDSSMHVRFTTDEMAFRAIYRVDGQPLWEAPLTPFKGSNTVSPYVTLATRA